MGIFSKLTARFRRDKWAEADEYQKARWSYEGEGFGATKASWFLGAALVVVAGVGGMQAYTIKQLGDLKGLRWVVVETNRDGEINNATITNGTLVTDMTKKRQFIGWWVEQWRPVGIDPIAYTKNFMAAQVYASDAVRYNLQEYRNSNPVAPLMQSGTVVTISKPQVTPQDVAGSRFRVDWTEVHWRYSREIARHEMTADVDLVQFVPRTAEEADGNLFGFVIQGFYWAPPAGA